MSTAYVENVVKPPSTPVPRKGRVSRCGVASSVTVTSSTPISAQPTTLISSVVHGRAPGAVGHNSPAP